MRDQQHHEQQHHEQQHHEQHHHGQRAVLRTIGPVLMGVGGILVVIGLVSFFSAFGGGGFPRYFWCAMLGLPMFGIGAGITKFGYLGAILRYQAREMTPVATDTFNDVVDGTQHGVRKMSRALGQGLSEGLNGGPSVECRQCGQPNDADARFCDECGTIMAVSTSCPSCHAENDAAARFCNQCGQTLS